MYPETTKKNENNKIDNPNTKWGQDLNRQHSKEGKGRKMQIKTLLNYHLYSLE